MKLHYIIHNCPSVNGQDREIKKQGEEGEKFYDTLCRVVGFTIPVPFNQSNSPSEGFVAKANITIVSIEED